jgi:hypothetical protein
MAVGESYLSAIMLAAGLTAAYYDDDVTALITAAQQELIRIGVDSTVAVSESDPLIRQAVRTYVKSNYAESEPEAARLTMSFESQARALSLSDGYMAEVVE